MRILLLSLAYAPEVTSTGKYTGEMGEWLAKRGHDVRVVTAPPFYPSWRIEKGYSAWAYRREVLAGTDVWRCPLWVPSKPSGAKRLLHLVGFAATSLPVMLRQISWRPEVVMVTEPPLFCVPAARLTAWLSGAKTWLHVLDFEVDVALRLGMLKDWVVLRRLMYGVEHLLLRRIEQVSTISEKMRRHLVEKGVPEERTWLFPNWAETDFVRPLPRDNKIRQKLFRAGPDEVLVLYAGNMGEKQGLDLVLDAAQQLKDRRQIRFLMVGAGGARGRLERLARERKLHNIDFFPVQPKESLPLMLAAGDIHLLVQRREAADLVMPSKLTNILAAGRPTVATVDSGTAVYEVLYEHSCGVTTLPDSATDFVRGITTLAEDPKMRKRLGDNARLYAESYLNKEAILSRFERELFRIGAGSRSNSTGW